MDDKLSNADQQWAAQVQTMERMVELANRLEQIVDQLIEIAASESNDQSSESHQDERL